MVFTNSFGSKDIPKINLNIKLRVVLIKTMSSFYAYQVM
jgi:hypothetical protein